MVKVRGKKNREPRVTSCLQRELAKENGVSKRVRIGTEKGTMVAKVAKTEEKIHRQKGSGKQGSKGQDKGGRGGREEGRTCRTWNSRTHSSVVSERRHQ